VPALILVCHPVYTTHCGPLHLLLCTSLPASSISSLLKFSTPHPPLGLEYRAPTSFPWHSVILSIFSLSFSGGTGVLTQGLTLARLVLYKPCPPATPLILIACYFLSFRSNGIEKEVTIFFMQ
jgi:hypothetical protein